MVLAAQIHLQVVVQAGTGTNVRNKYWLTLIGWSVFIYTKIIFISSSTNLIFQEFSDIIYRGGKEYIGINFSCQYIRKYWLSYTCMT